MDSSGELEGTVVPRAWNPLSRQEGSRGECNATWRTTSIVCLDEDSNVLGFYGYICKDVSIAC